MKRKQGTWGPFKLYANTDTVDIDDKCLGITVYPDGYPSPGTDALKRDRGLHIQIRHNRHRETFEAAREIEKLVAAAPDLLDAVRTLMAAHGDSGTPYQKEAYAKALEAVKKAGGAR